jgi:hypothetical protein
MIIPIDDKYRLKSDATQWMIQKFTPSKKKPKEWTSIKFFANPSNAVTELVQMRVRASDVETLAEALVEVENATQDVLGALTPHFEVKVKS